MLFAALRLGVILPVLASLAAGATDAEKLLEKNIKARGGLAAYQQIKVRRTVSTVKIGEQEVRTVAIEVPSDGRFYQSLENARLGRVEVGYDGKTVWRRSPQGQGELPADDPRSRAILKSATASEFWDYKKDERQFRYGGKEKLDAADYEVLESTFTMQDGTDGPAKYYFDGSGLLRVIVAGNDGLTRLDFADYRAVDGIQYPFTTKFTAPQTNVVTNVSEIRHNTPLDPAVFVYKEAITPPVPSAPPPKTGPAPPKKQ
jgi:hypothetical protein